jgi:hypothetical protein
MAARARRRRGYEARGDGIAGAIKKDVAETRPPTKPEGDPMIRNTLFGLSLLALTTGSAFAATPVKHTGSKPRIVAEAKTPAADSTAATDKPAKPAKSAKKSTKKAKPDAAAKADGSKEMKAAPEAK